MIQVLQTPKTLREHRVIHTVLLAQLILWIVDQGYEVATNQDGLKHMKNSLHYIGLADDLYLYKNGVYLKKSEEYAFAGEKWKTMHPLACWGGDFEAADGNHFSITYQGRK